MKKILVLFAVGIFFVSSTQAQLFGKSEQTDPEHAEFTIRYVPDSIAYLINVSDTLFIVSGQIISGKDAGKWRLLTVSPEKWREIVTTLLNQDVLKTVKGISYFKVVAANLGSYTVVEKKSLKLLGKKDRTFTAALNQNRKWKVTGVSPVLFVESNESALEERKKDQKDQKKPATSGKEKKFAW